VEIKIQNNTINDDSKTIITNSEILGSFGVDISEDNVNSFIYE
jgi:hypothetical protein